jgi:hypothetical protein
MDKAMRQITPGSAPVKAVAAILWHEPFRYVQSHATIIERVFGECDMRCRSRRRHDSNGCCTGIFAAQQYPIFSAVDRGKPSS